MKKTVFSLILTCAAFALDAQSFTATPNDSIVGTYDVNDWVQDYIHLNNNSGGALDLSWQTISNTMTSYGWNTVMCTSNGCFPYIPASGTLGTIADGDSGHIMVQIGFMGIAGTRQIRVRVYETSNPSNADTITWRYTAVSTAGISNTESAGNSISQNYPNPFSGSTTISYSLVSDDAELVITDLSGKTISTHALSQMSGQLVIADLSPGIYFYSLYCDGIAISTRKMIVE